MRERIEFSLGTSRFLGIFLGFLYISTLLVFFTLPIAYFLKILGSVFLGWRFSRIWALHVKRTAKNSVIAIWQDSQGRWGYKTRYGHCVKGRLKGDSFKCHWIIVLRLRLKTRTQNIIIPADALTTFQYRILCTRLNFFCDWSRIKRSQA